MKRIVLALAFLGLGAGAVRAEERTFDDWQATCDNVRACIAFGFPQDSAEADLAYLRIARGAMGAAKPEVALVAQVNSETPHRGDWTVMVDGRTVAGVPLLRPVAADNGRRAVLTASQAQALLLGIRDGRILTLTTGGQTIASLSLTGSAAALHWRDVQQRRVGTATALARPGPRPAGAVPAPPPVPVVRAATLPAQTGLPSRTPRAVYRALTDCEGDVAGRGLATVTVRVSPTQILWGLACSRGAYNEISQFILAGSGGGAPRVVQFPNSPGSENPTESQVHNAEFDARTGILSAFAKARGIGDCGVQSQWVWTGRGFSLLSERMMGQCRGVAQTDWPTTWRARLR